MRNVWRTLFLLLLLGGIGAAIPRASGEDPPKPQALAKARLQLARKLYEATEEELKAPPTEVPMEHRHLPVQERLVTWSTRWMEAERDANPGRAGRIAALEAHVKRLKARAESYLSLAGDDPHSEHRRTADLLQFYCLEAEYALAVARSAP